MTAPGVADPPVPEPAPAPATGAAERDAASFRDPSGFIFWQDGQPYRQIQTRFGAEWDAFEASPLKTRLIDQGWLIPYTRSPSSVPRAPTPMRSSGPTGSSSSAIRSSGPSASCVTPRC